MTTGNMVTIIHVICLLYFTVFECVCGSNHSSRELYFDKTKGPLAILQSPLPRNNRFSTGERIFLFGRGFGFGGLLGKDSLKFEVILQPQGLVIFEAQGGWHHIFAPDQWSGGAHFNFGLRWLEVRFTVTDMGNPNPKRRTSTKKVDLFPRLSEKQVLTIPEDLKVTRNGVPWDGTPDKRVDKGTFSLWDGSVMHLGVPTQPQIYKDGKAYVFKSWSDGGAKERNVSFSDEPIITATFEQTDIDWEECLRFDSYLDGKKEVPPNEAEGNCTGLLKLNRTEDSFFYRIRCDGLSRRPNAAHIHQGKVGKNGDVVVRLELTGLTTGHVAEGYIRAADIGDDKFNNLIYLFFEDSAYFNIHTRTIPTGEVRGQIIPPSGCLEAGNENGRNLTTSF
uniref:CHRD domain-containing protein n=1 Tax=Helicotheca tamesis TaxID=374047 RepID=A0A7S2N484_9STRA